MGLMKSIGNAIKNGHAMWASAAATTGYLATSLYTHALKDTTDTIPYHLNNLLDSIATNLPTAVTDKLIDMRYLGRDLGGGVDVPNISTPAATGFGGLTLGLLACKLSGDDSRKIKKAHEKIDDALMNEIINELETGEINPNSLDATKIYHNVRGKLESEKGSGFWIFEDSNKKALKTFTKYRGEVMSEGKYQEGSYMDTINKLLTNPDDVEGYDRLKLYLKEKTQKKLIEEKNEIGHKASDLDAKYTNLLNKYDLKTSEVTKLKDILKMYVSREEEDAIQKNGGIKYGKNPLDNIITQQGKAHVVEEKDMFKNVGKYNPDRQKSIIEANRTPLNLSDLLGKETNKLEDKSLNTIYDSVDPIVLSDKTTKSSIGDTSTFKSRIKPNIGKYTKVFDKKKLGETTKSTTSEMNPKIEILSEDNVEYRKMFKKYGKAGTYDSDFNNWVDSRGN